jgi:cell division protein ZapD
MIRVTLPRSATLYPEISAGRHRFTIRFMRPSEGAARPVQTDEDIEFGLQRCII